MRGMDEIWWETIIYLDSAMLKLFTVCLSVLCESLTELSDSQSANGFPHQAQRGAWLMDQPPGEPCSHHQQSDKQLDHFAADLLVPCITAWPCSHWPELGHWSLRRHGMHQHCTISQVHRSFCGGNFVWTAIMHGPKSPWLDQKRLNQLNSAAAYKQWRMLCRGYYLCKTMWKMFECIMRACLNFLYLKRCF